MKPIDLTKPLQTRDGRPAKFLHKLNGDIDYPIVSVVVSDGEEAIYMHNDRGQSYRNSESPSDLINVPVKHVREYWVNLYPFSKPDAHSSKTEADDFIKGSGRIACKKITVEFFVGEGLEGFKEPEQDSPYDVVKK